MTGDKERKPNAPSPWALRPGDLPSERAMRREPRLRGMENNAVFRMWLPQRGGRGLIAASNGLRVIARLRRSMPEITRDWWLAGLTADEIVAGLWAATPFGRTEPLIFVCALTAAAACALLPFPAMRGWGMFGLILAQAHLAIMSSIVASRLFEPYPALAILKLNHPFRSLGNPADFLAVIREAFSFILSPFTFFLFGAEIAAVACAFPLAGLWFSWPLPSAERFIAGYALGIPVSLAIGFAIGLLFGAYARLYSDRNYAAARRIVTRAFEKMLEMEARSKRRT